MRILTDFDDKIQQMRAEDPGSGKIFHPANETGKSNREKFHKILVLFVDTIGL